MKQIIISALLLVLSTSVFAQQGIVTSLSTPNAQGAKVTIVNPSEITTAQPKSNATIRAYRVRIYFDNSQDARSGSGAAATKFKELYPDTPTFTEYTAPYFKVTAGNFLTREEAIVLWGKIIGMFPNAFVIGETIPLSEFTTCTVLNTTAAVTPTETAVIPTVPVEEPEEETEE